jgi:twinkle protein
MISAYTIEAIKQAANVVEVVGDYVKLKKSGTDYEACCPFHNEKSPSFKVHPVKGIYKCFGCGTSGDAIEFVMKHQQKTYPEALEILAKRYNIPIEEDKPQPKRVYKRPQMPKFDLSPLALTYFTSRKISGQILADFKVTTKVEWMPKTKSEVECICFNYFRGGELINVKYRAKDKDFKLEKDAELIFYNLDSLKNAKYAVIVEGEIDALSVAQSGFKNGIVSVPNGANVTGAMKLEYLDNCYKEFEHIKQIVIFTDNDEAGRRLRDELGRRLGYDRCYMVTDYKGCKDANEILVKHDADAVLEAITSATEFPIEGIVSVDDIYKDVHSFYVNGYPNGFKSGIPNFDNLLQFMLGQFTVITGTPGCFTKNQMVHTELGVKPISEIKIGDKVLSYNHEEKENEYRKVTNTFIHETHTDKLYRLKMKDGTTIEVTENHEFFTGASYLKIKEILVSLHHENMEKNR